MARPSTSQTPTTQNNSNPNTDPQNEMIYKFSEQSGMTIEYSKL